MRQEGNPWFAPVRQALLCLLALPLLLPAVVVAQTTAPAETPPELRDFRLDPERARPQPETPPQTQPQPAPPPVTSTQPAPRPSASAPQSRQETRPQREAVPSERGIISQEQTDTSTAPTASAVTEETPITEQTAPDISQPEATPTADADGDKLWWQLGGAIAALAFVLAGIWWLRRQGRQSPADDYPAETTPPPPVVPPVAVKPAAPQPTTTPRPQPALIAHNGTVIIEFQPDNAILSLAKLAVSGKLKLVNNSDKPVEKLRLRVGLIGASAQQDAIINAFHAQEEGDAKTLPDLKPGEKRALALELSVPLVDLPSFAIGQQRMLVPILMANLSYGKARTEQVELSCMIGREATPPQPKMGPIRLDLGPRSFAGLGQRPLAA